MHRQLARGQAEGAYCSEKNRPASRVENALDDGRLFNARDHPEPPAAALTGLDLDRKDAFESAD
jgi:hypothetical protein